MNWTASDNTAAEAAGYMPKLRARAVKSTLIAGVVGSILLGLIGYWAYGTEFAGTPILLGIIVGFVVGVIVLLAVSPKARAAGSRSSL
ncbi:MAG: hypothetical protein ACFCVE_14330 [Phycisphaerae bacterium]